MSAERGTRGRADGRTFAQGGNAHDHHAPRDDTDRRSHADACAGANGQAHAASAVHALAAADR